MLENRESKNIPNVTFHTRQNGEWVDLTTNELFKGKKVVLFSLPGAFTPTCSSAHLPRFNELAKTFKANGIDDILCVSVNDTFVMNAWAKDQESDNVTLIPDGNGEFSDGMGMLVDKANLGFGKRSWRYSMLVNDGVIEKMFIEKDGPGDPFEVSDADTLLDFIAPNAEKPKPVTIFSKDGCPHCARAKKLLSAQGLDYEEITIDKEVSSKTLRNVTGQTSTPQVYIDGNLIGSADDLEAFFKG